MQILKRDGRAENFNAEKIRLAIIKAFESVNQIPDETVNKICSELENTISKDENLQSVESIQDLVEKSLMQHDYYEVAKSYILYRNERTKKRNAREHILKDITAGELAETLLRIEKKYPQNEYTLEVLYSKFSSFVKPNMSDLDKLNALIMSAVELTSQEAPKWEYIASMLLMISFKNALSIIKKENNIKSFYEKIKFMTDLNLYGKYILQSYTKDEIDFFESKLIEEKNDLLTYSSLKMLLGRYVIKTTDSQPLETPQEMFMGVSMHIGMNEPKETRKEFVVDLYNILSSLKATMATPTMSNARKPYHQLSSCFIDTTPDSLEGIYRSITNFAKVSKMGGGMGLYFGKIRAAGSSIRGFKGAAGGVIRWVRLVNDTAVAVDQLGVRQGAAAVYLDCWHKDLPEFLQIRTNSGDDRLKAHDVFPAICFPDLFWELARDNIDAPWSLMCPHEIEQVKGYRLEDFYGDMWREKYYDCVDDSRIPKRVFSVKEIIRLLLKSQIETGTPFVFNRDIVNKYNPNPHKGMIYCSNLCTEIAQNMSVIKQGQKTIKTVEGDDIIIEETKAGDFVVCNLASLVLGNCNVNDDEAGNSELKHITATIVRALDNVIDLNYYPLEYAKVTNKKYRAIGLGVSGYHHALTKQGISWESDAHLDFADNVFERINYYAVSASADLAIERGAYTFFEGSDWQTGNYFKKRNYNCQKWSELKDRIQTSGIRNSYVMAIAPTSSTSLIAGTTAGLDPVMNKYFLEEKKGAIVPRVAPDLNADSFWLYKSAYLIDQIWSIKAAGKRQRHIDQAQSMNLYITHENTMREILKMYILAWEEEVKTIYYVRSKSLEVEECESCAS
ncbi:MAG: ribonucleoside-diphosphate reductase subunit alpha [Treponema sp.]|nr:MAG: ribonucleoside-diphosphate reductase subunit alpha [Treponema sp.]